MGNNLWNYCKWSIKIIRENAISKNYPYYFFFITISKNFRLENNLKNFLQQRLYREMLFFSNGRFTIRERKLLPSFLFQIVLRLLLTFSRNTTNRFLVVIHSSSNILLVTNTIIMKSELKNVRDVMNKSIISVDKDDAIRMAVNKMVHGGIGAVIVTEKDKPVGILTERDILKFIANEKMDLDNNKVENIMSTPLISVDSSSSLEEAADVMLTNNIRRLIIKEKDEYVGLISQRELQRFITESR